jgi:sulfur carrier protein ThiS
VRPLAAGCEDVVTITLGSREVETDTARPMKLLRGPGSRSAAAAVEVNEEFIT